MSAPVASLSVIERLFPNIQQGAKTHTIRWREDVVGEGPLRFICDGAPDRRIDVEVTRVTNMPLSCAAAFIGLAEVWPDAVMLAGMREHYPAIRLDSVVQVIEFRLAADSDQGAKISEI